MTPPTIALLTDYGTRDWYAAAVKGVLLARCPQAQLVDVTHAVPPYDVIAGAFTLAAVVPWFRPGTVFLGVVDPEVGSRRALLAARADGRYLVGPDNGLLSLCLRQANRVEIVRLTKRRYWLKRVSGTFHGRDILAPVAAHLAAGGKLHQLGVPVRRIVPLPLPLPRRRGQVVRGAIVHIDAFGNLITNLPRSLLTGRPGLGVPRVRCQQRQARMVSSYADGRRGELVATIGALEVIELAVRDGSAARTLNAKRGDGVTLQWRG